MVVQSGRMLSQPPLPIFIRGGYLFKTIIHWFGQRIKPITKLTNCLSLDMWNETWKTGCYTILCCLIRVGY